MFFLFIFIILIIIAFAVHTSRIGIEIENLIIDTEADKGKKINKESEIYVYLLIFGKIRLFKKDAKNMKPPNFKIKNTDIDIKILKGKNLVINYVEMIKNIDIDIKKIDLNMQIGTQDAGVTAIIVGIISSILGIIIKKPKYEIVPVYSNRNFVKIKLDGIFSIYLMQYIYKLILHVWDRFSAVQKMHRWEPVPNVQILKSGGWYNMNEHPIENLMITAMSSIQNMVDVNTIIGEPIETQVGITIIPISKVSFGFAAGGSEFRGETLKEYNKRDKDEEIQYKLPFGGGAGAGVSINPVAFLVVQEGNVKLMPVDHDSCLDKILDYVPDLMQKLNEMFNK